MEELTESERATLHARLLALRDEIDSLLEKGAEAARPVALDPGAVGRISRGDALQQQAMASANRRSLRIRRDQCEAALAAFERAEYGDCRLCEAPIGFPRLEVFPEALLCIDCQRETGERGRA